MEYIYIYVFQFANIVLIDIKVMNIKNGQNYEQQVQYVEVTDPEQIKLLEEALRIKKQAQLSLVKQNQKDQLKNTQQKSNSIKVDNKKNKSKSYSKIEQKSKSTNHNRAKVNDYGVNKIHKKNADIVKIQEHISLSTLIDKVDQKLSIYQKVILKASNRQIQKAFFCSHQLHRKYPNLCRINKPGTIIIPQSKRPVPTIEVILSLSSLDQKNIGYQDSSSLKQSRISQKDTKRKINYNPTKKTKYEEKNIESDDSRDYR